MSLSRYERTRILVRSPEELASSLAELIRSRYEVKELEEPNEGLVMLTMRETAHNTLFHPGEVLVTEAKVRIGETIGIGILQGHHPRKALDLAVIDAAWSAGLPECSQMEVSIREAALRITESDARQAAVTAATRVSFETMDLAQAGPGRIV